MKSVIEWIKSNILADVAILVAIVSIAAIVFFHLQGGKLREEIQKRESVIKKINALTSKSINIPNEDPNQPEVTVSGLTVNPATIEAVQNIRNLMTRQAQGTTRFLVEKNQAGHELLLPGMLPKTESVYEGRDAYLRGLENLLAPQDEFGRVVEGVRAGLPPSSDEIEEELQKIRDQFTQFLGQDVDDRETPARTPGRQNSFSAGRGQVQPMEAPGVNGLGETDSLRLRKSLTQRLRGLLIDRARQLDVYADPRMVAGGARNDDFPFQVAEWALSPDGTRSPTRPDAQRLYEGQLEYWIQSDIVRAIARANNVGVEGTSVLNAPIKRLIKIEIVPGYIGLHGDGAQSGSPGGRRSAAQPRYQSGPPREPFSGRGNSSGSGVEESEANAPVEPFYDFPAKDAIGEADQPLPVDFNLAPTGRVSNAIYDVRHVHLTMVVDAAQLPAILRSFDEVNLMTVLDISFEDVDEWEALQEGYVYTGDVVQVEMKIETLWLRDWMTQYMPRETKMYLGILPPPDTKAR